MGQAFLSARSSGPPPGRPSRSGPARPGTAVVVGLGVTGRAVTRLLGEEGWRVVVIEDNPDADVVDTVHGLGATLGTLADVASADLLVPSPGVGPGHPVHAAAAEAGVRVVSEIELASRAAAATGKVLVAVTGTNGKTTVTTLVASMLVGSGRPAVAAGNIGLPLVEAVAGDVDVVVAEVSSFQLQYVDSFRPAVAVWLNLAEDHLDWHPSMEHYARAKSRIWANQGSDDVAVANAEDQAVAQAAVSAPGRVVTFGIDRGDYRVVGGTLCTPEGQAIVETAELARALPHDVANALAATAAARAAGAELSACRRALAAFRGLPHRLELVGEAGGVRYYDDSKATTPSSVLAALRGFESVVLIAGGRNKGLDLDVLAGEADRLRAVVAIGEAAPEVEAALGGFVEVKTATSMAAAVDAAREAARPGDVVILSPGCASFDWYSSYAERGDDFTRAVRRLAVAG
ncbi:MAG: UDP-N-acetylmuramoyl-L-alanine--D-glutamate ligase [Actinomycetota bacterium]|nr:UDP-N-acetylmuramoyl-L-alanine--D-glutamate ligase [Actinomycetota bacterium]